MTVDKLYNDKGQVAVAVSPGFGAGWSTWESPELAVDKRFNELFVAGDYEAATKLAEELEIYSGGIEDVVIKWLASGTEFKITDYDGYESIDYKDSDDWMVA